MELFDRDHEMRMTLSNCGGAEIDIALKNKLRLENGQHFMVHILILWKFNHMNFSKVEFRALMCQRYLVRSYVGSSFAASCSCIKGT